MTAEAPTRAVDIRRCARTACGAAFVPPADDPDQEACSRYCRSVLKMERSTGSVTPARARPLLMPGSELIGASAGPMPVPEPAPAPIAEAVAPVPAPARARLSRGHPMLGPNFPANRLAGRRPSKRWEKPPKARRKRWTETRVCAREGCETSFTADSQTKLKRLCSPACVIEYARAKRQALPRAAETTRVAVVHQPPAQQAACQRCGARFAPEPARPNHCSWPCVWATPADHAPGRCLCFACSERRQIARLPPLVGMRELEGAS